MQLLYMAVVKISSCWVCAIINNKINIKFFPQMCVGYEMVDSQQGSLDVSWLKSSPIQQTQLE